MHLFKILLKQSYIWIAIVILVIISLIVLMVTPTGVYKKQSDQVSQIYFADNISIAHQKIIDRFNQIHKDKIKVIPVNLPFTKFSTNERKELLARTLRSKSSRIDVFAVDVVWVQRFARWSLPLDDYFENINLETIIKPALESCYYKNQLMAIPLHIDIGLMYCRSDILKRLPNAPQIEKELRESMTWNDFIHLHNSFSDLDNPFYLFPAKNYEGLVCSFVEGIACQNQTLFQNQTIQLNTQSANRALQLLVDLVHRYKMTPLCVTDFDEYQSFLYALNTDALFLRGWFGFLQHYWKDIEDTSKALSLKMVALPHFQKGRPTSVFGGWNLMISKNTTKKDEAIQFIRYVLEPENQRILLQDGGYLPVIQSAYEDPVLLHSEENLSYYYRLLESGVHRPFHEDYTKISDILSYHLQQAIKKEMDVDEALMKATERINSKEVFIK